MSRMFGISQNTPNGQFAAAGTITDELPQQWVDPRWDYYRRGIIGSADPGNWVGLWPASMMYGGNDTTFNTFSIGYYDGWSWQNQWNYGNEGNGTQKFILGQVKDTNGNPVGGVVVDAYLTSNDSKVGSTASDSNGTYQVPTGYAGVNHYLVAYNAGNSTSGTTVNTLVPTNSDGT